MAMSNEMMENGNSKHSKEVNTDLLKRLKDGLIPDEEFRSLIRLELAKRLQWGYKSTHQEQLPQLLNLIERSKKSEVSSKMDTMDSPIYKVSIPCMELMLGSTLKQSCLYFKDESTTLDEAEIAMLDLYLEKADIQDGQSILDLGCGFGGLCFHIAQKFKNCNITALTNSLTQKNYIEEKCKTLNIPNVKVILADVATIEMESTFDRLFAIGLIEHMENYEVFLKKLSKWMKQDGLLFIEYLCHKTLAYEYKPMNEDDWHTNLFLPCGILASSSLLCYFQEDLSVVGHWSLSGKHFARSNEEWLKRIDMNMEKMIEINELVTGSKMEAIRSVYQWKIFCINCAEMFGYNNGEEWMISHFLFKKKQIH